MCEITASALAQVAYETAIDPSVDPNVSAEVARLAAEMYQADESVTARMRRDDAQIASWFADVAAEGAADYARDHR